MHYFVIMYVLGSGTFHSNLLYGIVFRDSYASINMPCHVLGNFVGSADREKCQATINFFSFGTGTRKALILS